MMHPYIALFFLLCAPFSWSESPLGYALKGNHTEIVGMLLQKNHDDPEKFPSLLQEAGNLEDLKDKQGNTAFDYALKKGHIRFLITLLLKAKNPTQIIQNMKKQGANFDTLDQETQTGLLHYLTLKKQDSLLKAFLEAGASPSLQDADQSTALHYAVLEKNLPLTKMLISAGASMDSLDKNNRAPFMIAVEESDADAIKLFLEKGSTPTQEFGTKTALSVALSNKNTQLIELFMNQYRSDEEIIDEFDDLDILNLKDDQDRTIVHWAAKNGHSGLMEALLSDSEFTERASISGIDKTGRTALHYGAQSGFPDIIEALISVPDSGLDMDALTNKERYSALHEAVLGKQWDAARMLLELKADKTLLDTKKKKALDYVMDEKLKKELDSIGEEEEDEEESE